MKHSIIYLFFFSLALYSCKGNKDTREKLIGSWHAVRFSNPDMDTFYRKSQLYIDTVGKNNDAETNIRLYGVANVDSMRRILQAQYDTAKLMQMNAVLNTVFTFRKDSVVVLAFNGGLDSSKWWLDKGAILLTDMTESGAGDKLKMDIIDLNDTVLVLKLKEDSSYTTVTFHPERK